MPEPVSAYQFLQHLAARWRVPVIACATAAVLAFAGSKLMTKEYVATARILIEPPGTSDPRSALVVTPVYMDSLRTYILFASSDELFKEAVETLGIRDPEDPKPLSRLKETILEVEIPRNTKVLEIRVTLTDPEKAHILAGYLAEATVRLNQELNAASDEARTAAPRRARDHAARRVRDAEKQLRLFARKEPVAGLEQELYALVLTRGILRYELLGSEDQQSEPVETRSGSGGGETEGTKDRRDAPGTGKLKSRTAHLREQVSQLDEEIEHIQVTLAQRGAQTSALEAERSAAWSIQEDSEARLLRERSMQSARGERLQIMDRGVVPERPSYPRVGLNVIVATGLALVLSLLYLTLQFSFLQQKEALRLQETRVARRE